MTELTISEARKGLLTLPQRLAKTPDRTASITRHGKRVLAVMPWEFYESIVETLDVLSDPDMVSSLRESVDDVKHGRLVSNEEARHRLGA
jgi:PHD/YefM family antitoxin component YafN of YafNO toxin-antitoxin module